MADDSSVDQGGVAADDAPSSGLIQAEKEAIDELHARIRTGDVYSILGVSPDADIQYIRKVYYELSRSWHPDQFYRRDIGAYKQRLEDIFVGVNRAYSILTDARRRADYDAEHPKQARADVRPAPTRPGSGGTQTVGDQPDVVEHEIAFKQRRDMPAAEAAPREAVVLESPRRKRRRGRVPGMERVHKQVMERLRRARRHSRAAEREAEEGNWVSAASNAYLAMQFDPEDPRFRALWEEYDPKGRTQLAAQYMALGESAMSYHNLRVAIHHFQRACDTNPPEARPFYELARLLAQSEEDRDDREIMRLLRRAVDREPRSVRYRLALADFYMEQQLLANARREFEEVLRLEPGNPEAKSGVRKVR